MTYITKNHVGFDGEKKFLSNMYPAGISLQVARENGRAFPEKLMPYWMHFLREDAVFESSEHLYQACKSGDRGYAELIQMQERPEKTKTLARKLVPSQFDIHEEFFDNRVEIMAWVVREKFLQNAHLQELLLSTGDEALVEYNTWKDNFWGAYDGVGKNNLGKILMAVRDEIRVARQLTSANVL